MQVSGKPSTEMPFLLTISTVDTLFVIANQQNASTQGGARLAQDKAQGAWEQGLPSDAKQKLLTMKTSEGEGF